MSNIDRDGYKRQRESERAWLSEPLTTGVAIILVGTNLLVTLLIVLFLG